MRLKTSGILSIVLLLGFGGWGTRATAQGPTISGMSPLSGPEETAVTISGSGFGATQGTSTLSFNGTTATASTWTDSTIVAILPSGVPSGPFTVTVNGTTVTTSTFRVTPLRSNLPLPSIWEDDAIRPTPEIWFTTAPSGVSTGGSALIEAGTVSWASATFSNGQFTLENNGAIAGTADDFHFVDQPLSGDGTIVARVVSVQGSGYPQAGVMIRETLDSGASNAFNGYEALNAGLTFMDRTSTGAYESTQANQSATVPYWVMLVKSGDTFSSYASADGVNWVQMGSSTTITMAQNVYIGLAVGNLYGSGPATATFDNVSVSTTTAPAPAITAVSATTGPVGVQVVISGSGFGAYQGNSLVTLNGSPATVNLWSATSITVTIPEGATSGPLVASVAPTMNDSNPVVFTVTSQPLPNPWLDQDVGQVGAADSATFASGTFTVQGSGTIGSYADGMHFAYEPLSGDGTIVARVASVQGSGYPQAGVMIRETLNAGASNTFSGYWALNAGMVFEARTSTGGYESMQGNVSASVPYWVELVRSGNTFSSYASADGVNWVQMGSSMTITMAQNVYVGLTVGNYYPADSVTATFDNVSISSTTAPAPAISGLSPSSGVVGTAVAITGTSFGASQGSSTVTFNSTPATPSSWGDTEIDVPVPIGATTGNVLVTVGGSASNGSFFTVSTGGAALVSIAVSPSNPTLTVGAAEQFSATGTFSDNSTQNLTTSVVWSSSNTSIATISNLVQTQGAGLGVGTGTASITATLGSITSSTGITIVPASNTPTISGLSPVLEQVGISVTITGTNFGSTRGSSTVAFNGILATPTAWSNTSIATTVPVGASTGYVVVTVGGAASNQELFAIVPPLPTITNLSPTSGITGTSVTINGSTFGSSQGASTVTLNGLVAAVTSWSDTTVVVNVPSNATTGNIVVTAGGVASNAVTFTVIGPTIMGLSSDAGAVGDSVTVYGGGFGGTQADSTITFNGVSTTPTSWSNMTIVVPVPTGAAIGRITVTVAGVSSTSTTFTVGPPDTITGLSISSPANGASVGTPYAAVTGSIAGSISGIDPVTVTCNDAFAKLTATNFSCNVSLEAGVNSITVTGTDSAGDTQTATLSVTLAMSSPISIQVTPPSPNMLVGATQSFTAVDDQGVRHPDATWTVSDSTIASFVSGSPNTLMADAVGQVTVTATVGGVSGQTTVTVLSGTSPSVGTVLWSAPVVSGFSTKQIVQAAPTADGPDLFAIDMDSNGDTLVRAFRSTGEQMWQSQISGSQNSSPQAVGDSFGGLLLIGWGENEGTPYGVITDLDSQSGAEAWQYATTGFSSISFGAIGLDGSVYAVENDSQISYLDSIDGASGGLRNRVQLPESTTYFNCPDLTRPAILNFSTGAAPGAVGPDGAFYAEVGSSEEVTESNCEFGPQPFEESTYSASLSLMRVSPDGGVGFSSLDSSTRRGLSGSEVIPDGQGGALASWFNPSRGTVMADSSSGGAQATFSAFSNGIDNMVLGDNNTAFATDGISVVAFNVPSLAPNWTYTSTGGYLNLVAAIAGGGMAIDDSQQGIIQLNTAGGPSAPVSALQGGIPFSLAGWQTILNGELAMLWSPDGSNGVSNIIANSDWPTVGGDPGENRPPRCSPNLLNCVLAPVSDVFESNQQSRIPPREITYGVFSLKNGKLIPLCAQPASYAFEISLEEQVTTQNTDTNHSICSPGAPSCSNRADPSGYKNGEFSDELKEVVNGITLSVSQRYFIDRNRVAATVYWPASLSSWFGSSSQTAATTTTTSTITQTPPLSQGAACGFQPYTSDIACDTTGP
jgi:regulation of enolase protein 1 (concanavalin A-like superfamily)